MQSTLFLYIIFVSMILIIAIHVQKIHNVYVMYRGTRHMDS